MTRKITVKPWDFTLLATDGQDRQIPVAVRGVDDWADLAAKLPETREQANFATNAIAVSVGCIVDGKPPLHTQVIHSSLPRTDGYVAALIEVLTERAEKWARELAQEEV